MIAYPIHEIVSILGAKLVGEPVAHPSIRFLSFDSRTILSGQETLFFALTTQRNDGHRYLIDAHSKEVRAFVVEQLPERIDLFSDSVFLVVPDTLTALQDLAAAHRQKFSYPVLGITGSNGKTIIKEWLNELLTPQIKIIRSPRSFNSQIGNPMSVWLMDHRYNFAIFEAGISQPGEMIKLEEILKPDHTLFAHIGHAHLENFTSEQELVAEKIKLAHRSKLIIYCSDFTLLDNAIKFEKFEENPRRYRWSEKDKSADLYITQKLKVDGKTTIYALSNQSQCSITIPFTDEASIENAIHCWAYLLASGLVSKTIIDKFGQLTPVAMRLEMKKGINDTLLINDSYNSDAASLVNALDFLIQQAHSGKRKTTVILSDLLQTGQQPEVLYQEIAEYLMLRSIDRLIGIGPDMCRYAQMFKVKNKQFYPTSEEFLLHFKEEAYSNEVILLKGARAFRFDRLTDLLQKKAHQTVMEIDLDAMVDNLNFYRSLLKPSTKMMAMVKAFSYGTGSVEVARVLQNRQIDYLAVAIADEGVELREQGIDVPIIVMNPEEHSFDTMIENRLEPNIYRFALLEQFEEALRKNAVNTFPIHLKIDTGMKRLGFDKEAELTQVADFIESHDSLYIRSIFTHLAVSDDPTQDPFTHQQFEKYDRLSQIILDRFDYKILRHVLNSSGIERFAGHQLDMVRLGIGLYGVSPCYQQELKNVATLKTTLSQIREVDQGDTIGYGRRGRLKSDSRIAVLPIGYADGLNRRLSNGKGKVWIHGKLAPIVGTICMDMCMVDLTGIDAHEGDKAIIFGEEYPIAELAKNLETIAYEILTTVGPRVRRVYFKS